ncbi:MerR family transcriptional regulator [Brevibacterium antiquum]|uniref:DNA-binding transcriptional regulator, MerR family n=1 Tax=Brevibacterium antiquum CNRZ 918 TaxID=1255637 RepID=A0A2H1JRE9_9MICO|nr:MerR family transcriptional regulator [Brevibacterium antiquum]SMX90077.1 DNA-binding transcriptional regulator, MerR family [Brevibacterium antiquum CNRZ 918]
MAWSTSELANRAGTTVKTVRHYHSRGLLPEPERASNGYKQYAVEHLVRVLQIRRLSDLGFTLAQIHDLDLAGEAAFDHGAEANAGTDRVDDDLRATLRALDAELEAGIARQQQMRDDIAAILEHGTAVDLPSGFGQVKGELTEADRGLLLVYSQVLDPETLDSLRAMLAEVNQSEASQEFQRLPAEADDAVREELARRYAPQVREVQAKYGWLDSLGEISHWKREKVQSTIGAALMQLYNPAQLDVLVRVDAMNSK